MQYIMRAVYRDPLYHLELNKTGKSPFSDSTQTNFRGGNHSLTTTRWPALLVIAECAMESDAVRRLSLLWGNQKIYHAIGW